MPSVIAYACSGAGTIALQVPCGPSYLEQQPSEEPDQFLHARVSGTWPAGACQHIQACRLQAASKLLSARRSQ